MYNIIASGSTGNCVVYHNTIMVDCGIPYSKIEPYIKKIQIVLLTHEHSDHLSLSTLKRMQLERPALRIACGEWMVEKLEGIRNIDIMKIGGLGYVYGSEFTVNPVKLYHDVPNFGWRIFKNGTKIFHATDTAHLDGIEAKNYDLYAIEHNYDSETINKTIMRIESQGDFAHQRGSINSHLSEQQARDFIFKNCNEKSKTIRLHESRYT